MSEALAGLVELLLQGTLLLVECVGRLLAFVLRAFGVGWESRPDEARPDA